MKKTYCQTSLTPAQLQAFHDLINVCQTFEPLRLGFPDDADYFLFTCEGTMVLSCLIVCQVQEDIGECYVFTHPEWRRKGLCRDLIGELCKQVPADTELVFLLDHQSPDALAAFLSLDMEHWRTEYQMERSIDAASFPPPSLILTREEMNEAKAETPGWLFSAYLPANPVVNSDAPPTLIGSCCLLFHRPLHFYLYHVEIMEKFRNQGWGTKLIQALLQALPQPSHLRLHVSSDNQAAVHLYKKTGFHITETLSYYLY